MSKKIIYLLSLLMALSLVFASCKKNSDLDPNNIGGGDQIKDEDNSGTTGENGLYADFSNIPTDAKPIITYKVFDLNGTETFRNSIVVPMGSQGNYIAVFSENRYTSAKSVNDIALDGETITDIVYNLNTKAGKENNWTGKKIVGTKATTAKDSHAAIVVFKISDTEVVIVASYGAGISRVSKSYDTRGLKSGLQYIKGTLDEGNNDFKWEQWTDITVNGQKMDAAIEALSFNDTETSPVQFKQFGTHSARGVVQNKKVYVPIVLANQGDSNTPKESMGNIILVGDFNSGATWTLLDNGSKKIAFEQIANKNGFTKQKESRVYDVDSSGNVKYLTVPSGSAASTDQYLFTGIAGQAPTKTTIQAGDGSVGLTKVKWYGSTPYTVADYKGQMNNGDKMLIMHVANTESNLHIYLTDLNLGGTIRKYKVNNVGKASSIDVLPDGTIITLAEEGVAEGTAARDRKFNVVFKRYSQAYLDSILK
ncbi:hypothetical protein [Brachyspira pilosicoli]|uniref:hypothetical protein n=1 Tax=Brachyspira pilosicoli TaxID=52584 RepID=UPI0012F62264|nr:hypothetical protein [Brachyspira pilosicoli]